MPKLTITEPRVCICGRDFLPFRCQEHCSPKCCRLTICVMAPTKDQDKMVTKCIVCSTPRSRFVRFAPCTRNCLGATYFASSRAIVDTLGPEMYTRRWQTACHLSTDQELERRHRPDSTPRIHVLYCSLRCYNSFAFGHDTRERQGMKRRRQKYEGKWRNLARKESGYFREYWQRRRIKNGELQSGFVMASRGR